MRSEASGSLATSLPCYNQRTAGLGQPPPCLGGGEPEARPVYGEVDRHPAEGGCGERGDTRRVRLARVRGTGRVRVRTRVGVWIRVRVRGRVRVKTRVRVRVRGRVRGRGRGRG